MNKKSILVIDDDVVMLKMMRSYLEEDFEVSIVPSGIMALKFLQRKSVDLIFLDYQMPKMNGPQTLQEIRKLDSGENYKIVFLTGEENGELDKYDVQGYILKPVTKEKLIDIANKFL